MSYALSAPLQSAVFAALSGDDVLAGLVGNAIFDALPAGDVPPLYVRLGEETVRDASDANGSGALHQFNVYVVSDASGYADAKAAAGAVSDILHNADLPLSRGYLVGLRFERATATFVSSVQARQIAMRFRARLQDS